MDLFHLQEHLKKENPEKKVTFEFPLSTHRIYEIVMSDGKPNPNHHVECQSVNVVIEGKEPYIERLTSPHRLTISREHMQEIIKQVLL